MTHVPFKGSGPAALELLAGRVDAFFATVPTILPHLKTGKLELLAVTSAQRSSLFSAGAHHGRSRDQGL